MLTQSILKSLNELSFYLDYQFGIQLTADNGSRILGTYCARNERDRAKFVEDLREAIAEVNCHC